MPSGKTTKGSTIAILIGAGILIIALLIFLFLASYGKNKGAAYLIAAIGILILFIGIIWKYSEAQAKEEKTIEVKQEKAKSS